MSVCYEFDPSPALRPMREADVAAVVAIETEAYEFPWTEGIFRDCLRVGYSCWVAETGRGLIGYAVMSLLAAGECHVLNVCVRPDHQGHGYGRVLLNHMLDLARGRGVSLALLEVRPSNAAALALYRSMGFNEVGLRRNYYPAKQGREDGLVLALELG
jgi:ribosomal-protein-alanine N-acetyltransferase